MEFNDYAEKARSTASYPKEIGLLYTTLGLNGEAGEIAEKVKKLYRDSGGVLTDEIRAAIAAEVGDVLWYAAMICTEIGYNLEDVARGNVEKLLSRRQRDKIHGSGDHR